MFFSALIGTLFL